MSIDLSINLSIALHLSLSLSLSLSLHLWQFTRTPAHTVAGGQALLGRAHGDRLVESLRHDGALLTSVVKDELTNTYGIRCGLQLDANGTDAAGTLSPVEAVAMVLRYAKNLAAASVGAVVKDVAITVPPYWSGAERQALLDAAKLAGLSPLALVNAGTAAGVNYVTRGELDDKPRYFLVYDMGAVDTSATLFEVKQVNETRGKFVKKNVTVGVLETIGVGWDETLGGRAFDLALARHFVAAIKAARPDIDVFANEARAWARLTKEAAKVKEVLSVNAMIDARVEGLVADYDFKLRVTRDEFEKLVEPLLARVAKPVETALAQAGVAIADVSLFEVVGGGWRVPAVQERLKKFLGRATLDQHINGDEAAVMGAAFVGASMAPGFRVKDFKIKDAVFSPIDVKITSQALADGAQPMSGGDDDEPLDKALELWKAGSRLRSKKTLTFSTSRNMTVALAYGAASLLSGSQPHTIGVFSVSGVPHPITHANLTGVPKVNAELLLDASGVVRFVKADAQFEFEQWTLPKAAKKPRASVNDTVEAAIKKAAADAKKAADAAKKADETVAQEDDDAAAADDDDSDDVGDEKADDAGDDAKAEPPAKPKVPGLGTVKPIDSGSTKIAASARGDLETWLGRKLEHFVPVQYLTYVDVDGELAYFFKIRTTNKPIAAVPDAAAGDDEPLAENATEAEKKAAADAKQKKELERTLRQLTADQNEYLHVRVNYDPSGKNAVPPSSSTPPQADADDEGADAGAGAAAAAAAAASQLSVQVRGVVEAKVALDALEYFDENIVPKAQVQLRTLTVALNVTQVAWGVRGISDAAFAAATAKLKQFDERDLEKRLRADAKNAVESYCYEMKEKVYDEAIEAVTLERERDEFRALLSDASDWLDTDGGDATTKQFQDKLASLRKVGDDFVARTREQVEAPKLAGEMRALVKGAEALLTNITKTHQVTPEEASGAVTTGNEAVAWLDKTEAAQAKLKAHEKRVLTVAAIKEAFGKFERRVQTLLKRPKQSKKPAPKKTDKKPAKEQEEQEKADDNSDADDEAKDNGAKDEL